MEHVKTVFFVGPFKFPWGQAGSRRVYGLAAGIANLGYNVVVASGDSKSNSGQLNTLKNNRILYYGLEELPVESDGYIRRFLKTFLEQGDNTIEFLSDLKNKPELIIVYGGYYPFIGKLLNWCRSNDIKLLVDVVEWYDPRQLTGGYFGPFHLSSKIALKYSFLKADGLICISSFLSNYYESRNKKCLTIPPTTELISNFSPLPTDSSVIKFIYAGTPGGKDLIGLIIDAFEAIQQVSNKAHLVIIGVSSEVLMKRTERKCFPKNITVLGRIEQEKVKGYIENSHFSVLMRPDATYSKAGFPTKFVESLSLGVPVISNLTSDLSSYLIEKETGFCVREVSVNSLVETLLLALSQDKLSLSKMRETSLIMAKKYFSVDSHTYELRNFIESL